MLAYYNERAPEYEDAYILGTGTASIPDPDVFVTEAKLLAGIVREFAEGRLIDLACGTGYWLPFYAEHCSHITLFDQSEKMLAECRKKLDRLSLGNQSVVLEGDFFDYRFGSTRYDCALVAFFLSHLTESQEPQLFNALRTMLGSSGRFLLLDSAWSDERARFNKKIEQQQRHLNDGTSFDIYKRYCDREDVLGWANKYDAMLCVEHFGTAFFAVSGRFNSVT
jgi:demethylmenaquinone methyltransferase/2-methoxy-6-polyprenyl-1,4-benzoquinol methylase